MVKEITAGKTATAKTTVTSKNTAKAVKSGSLDVFATPMMVALMEEAACNCLLENLKDGQTSVGTHITLRHTAPSPIGANITATATVHSVNGRNVEFDIVAKDDTGEIGACKHSRVIVDEKRFMGKLANL
jgi:predicted thioesterase